MPPWQRERHHLRNAKRSHGPETRLRADPQLDPRHCHHATPCDQAVEGKEHLLHLRIFSPYPCRVDGVIVSPEAVESPKRVLQRWVEAGRPAVAMYALLVSNAEFRAFKRAVEVQVRRFGAPVRKKTRADERPDENALIEPAVARALLEDLGRVDVGRTQHAGVQSLHAQCKVNAAVRCFQFGMILPPASVQVYPLSVV